MKLNTFITVFLLTGLTSCTSRKAVEFKKTIVQKEHDAFNIMVSKGGPEDEKLNCLIKHDFKGAILAVDKEEQAFSNIIKEIETLSADGLRQGAELKTAATTYYVTLKDLQTLARKEIVQREASFDPDIEKVQVAQDSLLQLTKERLKVYRIVSDKEAALNKALEKFDTANN